MTSLKFIGAFVLLLAGHAKAQLPFKNDSLYKTVYAAELCRMLAKNPDLVLIDVRTPGEYSDTSQYASLNIGHLKGAINLNIESIQKDIKTIEPYKNKKIVLYCSHSQRSRRVSKLLSENGFTDFYNLNGGMSVLTQLTENDFPCKINWIVSDLPFKNLSFSETADLLSKEKKLLVLDIRPANQYNSADSIAENNTGRLKGAINIPYDQFKQRINELAGYKQQPVLVYSTSGDGDAARTAKQLTDSGFVTVYHMLGGINDFIATEKNRSYIENPTPYIIVNPSGALALLKTSKKLVVYDTRTDEEYNNKLTGMTAYKNLGHIKNAIHINEAAFNSQVWPKDKNASILVYGNEESFKFSSMLSAKGYKHVYLLNGLDNFVWSGFNIESCKEAKGFMTDHAGLY